MDPVLNAPAPGTKISVPGIYSGISLDRYHADLCDAPSVSSSVIRKIVKESPADAFLDSPYNPDREIKDPSEAFILGHAAHLLLLGETHFNRQFSIRPAMIAGEPWQGNRKVCKEWLAEQAKAGRAVVHGEHITRIKGMAASLNREPLINPGGMLSGHVERSLFYKDPITGLWLKSRPDVQPTDHDHFVDLKTSAEVDDDYLENAMDDYGYYIQAALAGMVWRNITGRRMESFNFVFIKSKPPYSVNIITAKPSDIKDGEEAVNVGLRVFAQCLKTGEWFGPAGRTNDAKPLGRKPWAIEKARYRLKALEQELDKWKIEPTQT